MEDEGIGTKDKGRFHVTMVILLYLFFLLIPKFSLCLFSNVIHVIVVSIASSNGMSLKLSLWHTLMENNYLNIHGKDSSDLLMIHGSK